MPNVFAPAIYAYGTIYSDKAGFENIGINLAQRYTVFGTPDAKKQFIINESQQQITYPVECANLECLLRDMKRKGTFKWDIRLDHRADIRDLTYTCLPESVDRYSNTYILVQYRSGRFQFTRISAINWHTHLNPPIYWWDLSKIDQQAISQQAMKRSAT